MKIVLIGFGTVGQGLVQILRDKGASLKQDYGFEAHIVGVATRSRGTLLSQTGLDAGALLTAIDHGSLDHYEGHDFQRGLPIVELIRHSGADVLVEASPTNFETGQPSLDYCLTALNHKMHVVLANKGPVAVGYDVLMQVASSAGKRVLFEGTVMAGTPTLRLGMQALAGCTISKARGILNGTTNYMLTQMESGVAYADVLAEAQRLGYAEADPTADVDGWDAAGKAIILAAALFKKTLTFADMQVSGISRLTPDDIAAAKAAGERWKLIAEVTSNGGSVQPVRIPLNHPLAGVSGTTNAVTFTTDLLGDVTLVGSGAGRLQTGFGLLADLLDLHRCT